MRLGPDWHFSLNYRPQLWCDNDGTLSALGTCLQISRYFSFLESFLSLTFPHC